jgi:hypothetical protein
MIGVDKSSAVSPCLHSLEALEDWKSIDDRYSEYSASESRRKRHELIDSRNKKIRLFRFCWPFDSVRRFRLPLQDRIERGWRNTSWTHHMSLLMLSFSTWEGILRHSCFPSGLKKWQMSGNFGLVSREKQRKDVLHDLDCVISIEFRDNFPALRHYASRARYHGLFQVALCWHVKGSSRTQPQISRNPSFSYVIGVFVTQSWETRKSYPLLLMKNQRNSFLVGKTILWPELCINFFSYLCVFWAMSRAKASPSVPRLRDGSRSFW